MKLVHQINVAFGVLLVAVLGITAVVIHYVLMDHFITAQRQELQSIGMSMATTLSREAGKTAMTDMAAVAERPVLQDAAASRLTVAAPAGVEYYLSDTEGNVLQTGSSAALNAVGVQPLPQAAVTSMKAKPIEVQSVQAIAKVSGYITNVSAVPQGTLTLLSPLSKIKEVEQDLFVRLLLVLAVGGVLVMLLSLLITRRLIRPLMRLREELRKVQRRQFGDVALVKAGGEIGAVARSVYELAGELERHNRAQKQFFQNASHELKTPLMSIAGYAEGIRDGVFEGESSHKGLDIIISESGRLTSIVTEMTLLAKLDSEEDIFRASDVHVQEIVTETIERINPLLAARGLAIHTRYKNGARESRLAVSADRDKLLQALLNIVSNAARYATETIVIEIGVEGGQITLSVADDGKGFPDSLLPQLFHRFIKGKDGQTGLGLAISRAIVERCGGRIEARNQAAGGAVISLRLPQAA